MADDAHKSRADRVNRQAGFDARAIPLFGFYGCARADIEARPFEWGIDPRMIEWTFDDTEKAVWDALRARALFPYPQFPIGRYYVDFALFGARLAIDCDGAAFRRDWSRDGERQAHLLSKGWTVWSISRHDCLLATEDPAASPLLGFANRVDMFVRQRRAESIQAAVFRASGARL